ncbi:MAG: hypothetical protein GY817_04805 [bacterium]|nr:hypothetical protein [bacterium]
MNISNIFRIRNIKKKQLADNIDIFDFIDEKRLCIYNQNGRYANLKLHFDFINSGENYTIQNLISDEVYFKTGKDFQKNGFDFLVVPNETAFYSIKKHKNVDRYFEVIINIIKDKPLSSLEIKNFDFSLIIKTIFGELETDLQIKSTHFYTVFSHNFLFVMNEDIKSGHDTIITTYFNETDCEYFLLEDMLNDRVYLRKAENLQKFGLKVLLKKNAAHCFRIEKINGDKANLYSLIYDQVNLKGIPSEQFFKNNYSLDNKNIVYMCMEMFIPELYSLNNDAVEANFNGGLGILAGCSMEGFAEIGLSTMGVIPLYQRRRIQTIDKNLRQVIKEKVVDYKGLHPVINQETGEQLEILVFISANKYVVKIWQINRGGSTVYLLEEPLVFDILYTGSREHRLLQEVLIGKVTPVLLRVLDIKPAVLHLNEAHPVLSAVNLKEWKNMTNGDNFFEDTRILFTIHTPRAAGLEIFYTAFDDLEIPYSYKKIFDPENKGKLDFTHAAAELADRINTVSANQVGIVKERILTNKKFHHKIIGIMNGASASYWNSKRGVNQQPSFLNPKKISAWAVRRIVDYKNQWPLLKDIIRILCGELGFQVIVGGMAHPNDEVSQSWIYEFCNWMNGRWRSSLSHDFEVAPELVDNFFFIPAEEGGLGRLLRDSAEFGDVCLEIPALGEEACGTSGMRSLGHGNITVNSSDGALEWLSEGENSFMLKPYSTDNFLNIMRKISNIYYNDYEKFKEIKQQALLTWQHKLNINIMSRHYYDKMFLPAILAHEICRK